MLFGVIERVGLEECVLNGAELFHVAIILVRFADSLFDDELEFIYLETEGLGNLVSQEAECLEVSYLNSLSLSCMTRHFHVNINGHRTNSGETGSHGVLRFDFLDTFKAI